MARRGIDVTTAFQIGAVALLGFGAWKLGAAMLSGDGSGTFYFVMRAGAFPPRDHPSVAVRIPPGFDRSRPLGVAVYLHGWSNCVANAIGSTDSPCVPGGVVHRASALAEQFDRARINAILVVPQMAYNQASGDPGTFSRPGGFRAFIEELLSEHLASAIGRHSVADVARLAVMSHSGGYLAAAAILRQADVRVAEVAMLDSLYGEVPVFERWIESHAEALARGESRFADVYTSTGGTRDNSNLLARRIRSLLPTPLPAGVLVQDEDPGHAVRASVLIEHTALSHADLTRVYPERLWSTSGFTPIG